MEQIQFPDFPQIVADIDYCDGQPRIAKTRITVTAILSYIAGGMTFDDLIQEFPSLKKDDIQQALAFATAQLQVRYLPLKRNAA
jgi:uncharacterized protein (DUF433 family)